jgi:hypothetical protein
MKHRTGNHTARRAAAKNEPSPLTAVRELLAAAFAADVAAVTPMVCDVLRDEIAISHAVARRDVLRHALVLLARNTEALGEAAGRLFRERFDLHLTACELPPGGSPELARALQLCASRLREQAGSEVDALSARFAELLGHDTVDDRANPIVPEVFARTLLEALRTLGLEGDTHLAAFRAFGPALLHITPDLYAQANMLLFERDAAPAKDDRAAVLERLLAGRTRR